MDFSPKVLFEQCKLVLKMITMVKCIICLSPLVIAGVFVAHWVIAKTLGLLIPGGKAEDDSD